MEECNNKPVKPTRSKKQRTSKQDTMEVDEFRPSSQMVDVMLVFLMRLALVTAHVPERAVSTLFISRRCVNIMRRAYKTWTGGRLKFQMVEKMVSATNRQRHIDDPQVLKHSLDIFNVAVQYQKKEFTQQELSVVLWFLKRVYTASSNANAKAPLIASIQESACHLISKLLQQFPVRSQNDADKEEPTVVQFRLDLCRHVTEMLLATTNPDATTNVNLQYACVLGSYLPDYLTQVFPAVAKVLPKLVKEHICQLVSPANNQRRAGDRDGKHDTLKRDTTSQLARSLVICLHILKARPDLVGDHRKYICQSLQQLMLRSTNSFLLEEVTSLVSGWLTPEPDDDDDDDDVMEPDGKDADGDEEMADAEEEKKEKEKEQGRKRKKTSRRRKSKAPQDDDADDANPEEKKDKDEQEESQEVVFPREPTCPTSVFSSAVNLSRFIFSLELLSVRGTVEFSLKERSTFLVSMCRYENIGHMGLLKQFLDIVYSLYMEMTAEKKPTVASAHRSYQGYRHGGTQAQQAAQKEKERNAEFALRLMKSFMIGLRCSDVEYRQRFFDLFQTDMKRNIFARLEFIFSKQVGVAYWYQLAISVCPAHTCFTGLGTALPVLVGTSGA